MKTKAIASVFLLAGMMLAVNSNAQSADEQLLANKAYRALCAAGTVNGFTTGLGLASNIEMIVIGGFPTDPAVELNAAVILTHMPIAISRVATSIVPPIKVAKAQRALSFLRSSPDMTDLDKKLFGHLKAARTLTVLAPVLCITGGVMMVGLTFSDPYTDYYDPETGHYGYKYNSGYKALKSVGWICVGAGLAASISGQVFINLAKHDLAKKIGTFKVATGPDGVGVKYNLPVKK